MEYCSYIGILMMSLGVGVGGLLFVGCSWVVLSCWVLPLLAYIRIKRNGFDGPSPSFPLGNTHEMMMMMMMMMNKNSSTLQCYTQPAAYINSNIAAASTKPHNIISHDIHSTVFPYFKQWQNSYGKVLVYWLGTEPFVYIADAEFLRKMAGGVLGKTWGKPDVFKHDRKPMFGKGLVMVEGDDWLRHRHVITPAFSPTNLKAMASMMMEPVTRMVHKWDGLIKAGTSEIDAEKELTATAGEILSRTSFGLISHQSGSQVFEKLREMQMTLFNSNRYVGVPFSNLLCLRQNLKAKSLGKQIDGLLMDIITARKRALESGGGAGGGQKDLLGLLVEASRGDQDRPKLTTRELVDECKTFFFGGHETTALALTWTLLLLAEHPRWQNELRDEIHTVVGDHNDDIDFSLLAGLKKMGWVMNEVLRLYSPSPNAQRQAREDIRVDDLLIPKGTNMWIDLISIHHDASLWGDDVHEFHPERFQNNIHGGCKNKMGFLPFGFGGRMCVGRNLTTMEYKLVLTQLLTNFSFSLSPNYCHSPSILLTLRPKHGLPLIVQPLAPGKGAPLSV